MTYVKTLVLSLSVVMIFTVTGPVFSRLHAQLPDIASTTKNHNNAFPQESANVLDRVFNIAVKDVSLKDALEAVRKNAKIGLTYDPSSIPNKKVSLSRDRITVKEALEFILKGTGVAIEVAPKGNVMLVPRGKDGSLQADSIKARIRGRVLDSATKEPIGMVTVSLQGMNIQQVTNDLGNYVLPAVPSGEYTLSFRLLGYGTITRKIVISGKADVITDVALAPMRTMLQGVVTTATGIKRRVEVGNDITTIDVEEAIQNAPIKSITELLETRVPGLVVQRTSGSPGDPARIRLRGTSSINGNNDPIVVVDGVRVYAQQSDTYNNNLAPSKARAVSNRSGIPVASPLDQIDPNSIETIEVFKGPSAAAMYGSDAANGVIVITTKKGKSGPLQWSFNSSYGISKIPGKFPNGIYRYGSEPVYGNTQLCTIQEFECQFDSLVIFQALNEPRFSPLGTGNESDMSVSLRGGIDNIQYSITPSLARNVGVLKLPPAEFDRFKKLNGFEPPRWFNRPDRYDTWGMQATVNMNTSKDLRVNLTSMIFNSMKRNSQLSLNGVSNLIARKIDTILNKNSPIFSSAYEKIESQSLSTTHNVQTIWQAREWMPITANIGLNIINRNEEAIRPWLEQPIGPTQDSVAAYGAGRGQTMNTTSNVFTQIPLLQQKISLSLGLNYNGSNLSRMSAQSTVPPQRGVEVPTSNLTATQATSGSTTFGWFIEPRFNLKSRFFASPGIRLDNNGLAGSRAGLLRLPKMNFSWIASEEPYFPQTDVISMLRIRTGVGVAGVQPGPTDRLRTWSPVSGNGYNNAVIPIYAEGSRLGRLGNSKLKPERSTEFEGGADLELWEGRVSMIFSGYRKKRYDAIVSVPIASSVSVGGNPSMNTRKENIGEIVNTGMEFSLDAQVIERREVTWSIGFNFSRNANEVTRLNAGRQSIEISDDNSGYTRIIPGYPLNSRWAKPILGYEDLDGNNVIQLSEIVIGDSLVYLGSQEPTIIMGGNTGVVFLNGRLRMNANFSYTGDMVQHNYVASRPNSPLNTAANDPKSSLAAQAASLAARNNLTQYGVMQTVNSFRFETVSLSYVVNSRVASFFRARNMSIAIQGKNIGLITNYSGKDPNVNTFTTGNATADDGALPQPRVWSLRVSLGN